jgi:hypothetical protein
VRCPALHGHRTPYTNAHGTGVYGYIGVLSSLMKLRIISIPAPLTIHLVCCILQQTKLPRLCEFELELRPKVKQDTSFMLMDPNTSDADHDWTVPPALAAQLRIARVTLRDVEYVGNVGYVRNLFRHTKPGVFEIVAAPGVILHED